MRRVIGKNPVRIQKIPEPVKEEEEVVEPVKMEIKDIPKEEIFEDKSNKEPEVVQKKEAPEPTFRRRRQLSEKQLAA